MENDPFKYVERQGLPVGAEDAKRGFVRDDLRHIQPSEYAQTDFMLPPLGPNATIKRGK